MREDGTVGTNYDVKYVYDISQLQTKYRTRSLRFDNKILLKILLNSSLANVKVVDEIPNTNRRALYNKDAELLYIARGAEAPQIFYEVTHELAKQEIGENSSLDAFKNYCASYMICKKYNIDVSNYKFDKGIEQLQGMDAREIKEELEPMRNALEHIEKRMSNRIKQIMLENKEKARAR